MTQALLAKHVWHFLSSPSVLPAHTTCSWWACCRLPLPLCSVEGGLGILFTGYRLAGATAKQMEAAVAAHRQRREAGSLQAGEEVDEEEEKEVDEDEVDEEDDMGSGGGEDSGASHSAQCNATSSGETVQRRLA